MSNESLFSKEPLNIENCKDHVNDNSKLVKKPMKFHGELWQWKKKIGKFQRFVFEFYDGLLIKINANGSKKEFRLDDAILDKSRNVEKKKVKPNNDLQYYFSLRINEKTMKFYSCSKMVINQYYNLLKRWCFLTNINEDYEFISKIGSGHSSIVWKIRSKTDKTEYAGKIITLEDQYAIDAKVLKEIKINREICHPCIPNYQTAYVENGKICLIFDLVEGSHIQEYLRVNGVFKEDDALSIMKSMLEVLVYLKSRNIIHNDLKFNNIFVTNKDDNVGIKIIDFGLSTYINEYNKLSSSDCCGTIGFIAPEILEGKEYDHKADVFSLGVISYTLLTGKFPFKLKNQDEKNLAKLNFQSKIPFPLEYWGHISRQTMDLIIQMTQRDPFQRYSAEQALEVVKSLLNKGINDQSTNSHSRPMYCLLNTADYSSQIFLKSATVISSPFLKVPKVLEMNIPNVEMSSPYSELISLKGELITPKRELNGLKSQSAGLKRKSANLSREIIGSKDESVTLKGESVGPKSDRPSVIGESINPRGEPVNPKGEPAYPKGEPAYPKGGLFNPKGEASSAKGRSASPKCEVAGPKDEPVHPKGGELNMLEGRDEAQEDEGTLTWESLCHEGPGINSDKYVMRLKVKPK